MHRQEVPKFCHRESKFIPTQLFRERCKETLRSRNLTELTRIAPCHKCMTAIYVKLISLRHPSEPDTGQFFFLP